ncbi:unnamed protein product [Anisakis simplex]|uniref:Protein kinase domain-containing protein n=1 Tax=Anisakis simplex TaxID=6269 RepID=A0A0M3J019_ANISI|nr:unnamed protein product [Anisakis simplex]
MDASSLLKWLSSFLGWLWSMLIWPIWTGDNKMAKHLQIPKGQLEFGECVGEGGFGQVFRGKWKTKEGEKTVAMKRVTKFEKEVKILSEFDHPNVIQFYGVSEDHLGYIIVTEYAEGGSLYDHLHNGDNTSIDFKQIITWALEIARGVEYLHYDAPVKTIHRDLKSKNVVLTSERVCKLCDFGASKNSVHSVTSTSLNGTIPWMSPEQIKRDRISTATDVWSYGVILWEMITRKMPYKGLPELTVFGSIANNGSTLVIPEDCPAAFKRLMQNCWIMEPENRYNMRQVISALNDMQMEMQPETMLRNELQKMRDELQKTMRDELRKTREEMKQNLFGAIALMRTLGECVSDEDLTRALRLTGNDPSMVLVYDAIKCRKRY